VAFHERNFQVKGVQFSFDGEAEIGGVRYTMSNMHR